MAARRGRVVSRRDNVWANEGGTPGMPICKIELGSEAWSVLEDALTDRHARLLRISAADGHLKIKVDSGIWTYQLDVEAES